MLQRKSDNAPEPASARRDGYEPQLENMARAVPLAVALIKPKPEQGEKVLKAVVEAICIIAVLGEDPGPATNKKEMLEIVSVLRGAIAALEHPFAAMAILCAFEREAGVGCVPPEPPGDRVRNLRKELAAIAETLQSESERIKITKGRQQEGKKLVAALMAHRLLCDHGVKPTLSEDGAFFSWLRRSTRALLAL
jgi:hypothetical protein